MREAYKGVFKDEAGTVIEELDFPMCQTDRAAIDTIRSVCANQPKCASADVYRGRQLIARVP